MTSHSLTSYFTSIFYTSILSTTLIYAIITPPGLGAVSSTTSPPSDSLTSTSSNWISFSKLPPPPSSSCQTYVTPISYFFSNKPTKRSQGSVANSDSNDNNNHPKNQCRYGRRSNSGDEDKEYTRDSTSLIYQNYNDDFDFGADRQARELYQRETSFLIKSQHRRRLLDQQQLQQQQQTVQRQDDKLVQAPYLHINGQEDPYGILGVHDQRRIKVFRPRSKYLTQPTFNSLNSLGRSTSRCGGGGGSMKRPLSRARSRTKVRRYSYPHQRSKRMRPQNHCWDQRAQENLNAQPATERGIKVERGGRGRELPPVHAGYRPNHVVNSNPRSQHHDNSSINSNHNGHRLFLNPADTSFLHSHHQSLSLFLSTQSSILVVHYRAMLALANHLHFLFCGNDPSFFSSSSSSSSSSFSSYIMGSLLCHSPIFKSNHPYVESSERSQYHLRYQHDFLDPSRHTHTPQPLPPHPVIAMLASNIWVRLGLLIVLCLGAFYYCVTMMDHHHHHQQQQSVSGSRLRRSTSGTNRWSESRLGAGTGAGFGTGTDSELSDDNSNAAGSHLQTSSLTSTSTQTIGTAAAIARGEGAGLTAGLASSLPFMPTSGGSSGETGAGAASYGSSTESTIASSGSERASEDQRISLLSISPSTLATGLLSALMRSTATAMALTCGTDMPCSASTTPNAPHSSTGQFESAQDEKPGFEESEDGAKKGSCDRDSTAQDIRNINKKIKIAGSDTEFKTMKCDDYSAGKEHKDQQDDSDLFTPLFDCQMFRDLQYKVPSYHECISRGLGESSRSNSRRSSIISPSSPSPILVQIARLPPTPIITSTRTNTASIVDVGERLGFRSHFYNMDALRSTIWKSRRSAARRHCFIAKNPVSARTRLTRRSSRSQSSPRRPLLSRPPRASRPVVSTRRSRARVARLKRKDL